MQTYPLDKVHCVVCHECKPIHNTIVQQLLKLSDAPETHKTHLFNGRYENIYLSATQLPALQPILNTILEEASRLLDCEKFQLQLGFWFNVMHKGDTTTLHSHDDNDELISGTYYLQVSNDAAKLRIKLSSGEFLDIAPQEAGLLFFHPARPHEVIEHESSSVRISLGFNIGAVDAVQD